MPHSYATSNDGGGSDDYLPAEILCVLAATTDAVDDAGADDEIAEHPDAARCEARMREAVVPALTAVGVAVVYGAGAGSLAQHIEALDAASQELFVIYLQHDVTHLQDTGRMRVYCSDNDITLELIRETVKAAGLDMVHANIASDHALVLDVCVARPRRKSAIV